ncbi:MAG: LON peptidase substrate-binding domain-containing protein, partial [Gemmatimonadetes bacterium]|nr:LON peptidase substrate-binding domain-containing protein [Gemmatimonadota bacterium]
MAQANPKDQIPRRLPVLPLRSTVVFPMGVIGIQIGMPSSLEMLSANPTDPLLVALVVAPGGPDEPVEPKSLRKVGVVTRLSDRLNLPGGTVQATIQGLRRVRLTRVDEVDGYFVARIDPIDEIPAPPDLAEELIARIITTLEALSTEVDRIAKEVPRILRMNVGDPGRFADLVASLANFSVGAKEEVLRRLDVADRLRYVLEELEGQLRRVRQMEAPEEAAPAVEEERLSPSERADRIRDRIRRLQAQLGEADPSEREAIDLLRRIEAADLPARVAAEARAEVERLRTLAPSSGEASEIRSYIDWLLHIPWRARAAGEPGEIDLKRVTRELDAELLDLDEPKSRLLDYLAVARLRGDLRGPIPCIVGPPEVGKESLATALARGLGRPLARLDLGNRGESQLVGTRRTRAGAQPGKIAQALRDVGVRDPVILLGEMDEIGLGKVEGDPIEAMEEILDWETRQEFVDRYLDLPLDLGDTLFIATAQDFFRVPRSLRDLMVEIRIAGYTPEEKVEIVRGRLLSKLIAEHGLDDGDVAFPEDVLFFLARGYARDAGLGAMRRMLSTLLRTRARAKALGESGQWVFTTEKVEEILGLPRYVPTPAENAPEIGVVTG